MLAGPWSEKSIYKYSFLPKGSKKLFLETASPFSKGLDDYPPPPPPPTHTHTHDRPTPAPLILRSGAGTERYHFRAAPSLVGHQIEYLP